MGKHQMAHDELAKLQESAKDDGQRRTALFAEAVCYADEGSLDQAMECIKKQHAIAENINDVSAMAADLNTMGTILMEMGRYDEALAHFKNAVKLVEDSDLAQEIKDNARRNFLYNSAKADLGQGEIATAKEKAQKHLALSTKLNNPFQIRLSHELAGIIALHEKDFDKAIEELEQSNLQNPYNHFRLAQAFHGGGKPKQAKMACNKAAHYNALNNLNYAFIRHKAEEMLGSL
jgi:tetratricopeptide (TPR) repeat protein